MMEAKTTSADIDEEAEHLRDYSSKFTKLPPKDPRRCGWRENASNTSLSGIEFREADTNTIVHFITIQHKELHKDSMPYRMVIPVYKDGTFTMPRKQTFEEMIQFKRRQHNATWSSSGHQATTSSVLSSRAARRVSNAARRQSSALNSVGSGRLITFRSPSLVTRPTTVNLDKPDPPAQVARSDRSKKKKSSKSSPKKSSPKKSRSQSVVVVQAGKSPAETGAASTSNSPLEAQPSIKTTSPMEASTSETSVAKIIDSTSAPIVTNCAAGSSSGKFEVKSYGDDIAAVTKNKTVHLISSMKELSRQNPSLGSMDKKEIKRLLKSAPPGAALVLSNGTVIKKSRRGGARAGAGRKRSRPSQESRKSPETNTASCQTILNDSGSTSELSIEASNTSYGSYTVLEPCEK